MPAIAVIFILLDMDESCPTADLSNIGHTYGPAYSTGRLLNMPQIFHAFQVELAQMFSLWHGVDFASHCLAD